MPVSQVEQMKPFQTRAADLLRTWAVFGNLGSGAHHLSELPCTTRVVRRHKSEFPNANNNVSLKMYLKLLSDLFAHD